MRTIQARQLLRELNRRHVLRAGSLYIAGSWILLQAVALLAPELGWPPGTFRVVLYAAIAGLPVALILAWVIEPRQSQALAGDAHDRIAAGERPRRLIVLPFKQLRPDPETEFLSFSLPDAVTCSLSGLPTLIVLSSAAVTRLNPDDGLQKIADRAGADLILTGTLLRNGAQLRIATQLVSMPDAAVIDSRTAQFPLDDLFQLQDMVAQGVLSKLALPPGDSRTAEQDVPASGQAYQTYLRANQLAMQSNQWEPAADLYLKAVAEDPTYAPAWARLGRAYRLIAKYSVPREQTEVTMKLAEQAFERSLSLNPDLPLTHSLYAQFQVDNGDAREAMVRLLQRVETNGADPELFAGLVQACRFAGLLRASVRAHERARALDPNVLTSVAHSYFMLGDYQAAVAEYKPTDIGYMRGLALVQLGRREEALGALIEREALAAPRARPFISSLRYLLEGDTEKMNEATAAMRQWPTDAEGQFYFARHEAFVGRLESAAEFIGESLRLGYVSHIQLQRDPWLQPLRAHPAFPELERSMGSAHAKSLAAYEAARGNEILGAEER